MIHREQAAITIFLAIVTVGCTGGLGRSPEGNSVTPQPQKVSDCSKDPTSCGPNGGNSSSNSTGGTLDLNGMDNKCRKVYKYSGTVDGSAVVEDFEWDFTGSVAKGYIKYTKTGIPPVPLSITLKLRESSGNAYTYDVTQVEGSGAKPDSVSFTCNGDSMVQKESRSGTSGPQERSFTLKRSS